MTHNVIPYEKSFASHEKFEYWSEKNGDVKPRDVYKSSHKKYWFDCNVCNHSFDSAIYNICGGKWCSFCANKKRCENECEYCFQKTFASHEKSEYWSEKNGDVKPRDVSKSSHKKYWFDCNVCNHSFDSCLASISSDDAWCPYCGINKNRLCSKDTCNLCFKKSFASHEKAEYWSEKNGDVKPRDVNISSNQKYWFDCNVCNHSFDSTLSHISTGDCSWCPYCANKKICETECNLCFQKSFASHEKVKYWSKKNGDINPRYVSKCNGNKYWFDCNVCNHSFDTALSQICRVRCSWCPYCANKKLCETECDYCFNNSFASHENVKYWSKKNGDINPRYVSKCNGNKYWFDCNGCNNTFDTALSHICRGQWCPICKNKTEKKLYNALICIYPNIIRQYKQEWCKNKTFLPFDFCNEEYKIIIELDGRQHFIQVSNWSSPEEQFENDKYKEKCANENGYSIVRLLQEDVLYDRYDWLNELNQTIEKIKNEKIIQNIYMCKNNEYNVFEI